MSYDLPKSVDINGQEHEIRYDYRVILEIFEALNDPELSDRDRASAVLSMFYVNPDEIDDYDAAISTVFWFINGGEVEKTDKKQPRLVCWEQDFPYIVAPVNRVLGYEIRSVPYDVDNNTGGVHWWTLLSAYMEIGGDCVFAQIVGIRAKKSKKQKLDKSDREFYRKNKDIVDIKTHYTADEEQFIKDWTGSRGDDLNGS